MGLDGTGSLKHSTTNKISCKIPSAAYTGQTVQLFYWIFLLVPYVFCPILKTFVGLGYPPKMGLTWFFLNFLLELTLHPSKFRKKHPCWLGKTSLLSNVWFWMKDCPLVPCWDYDLEAASCYPAVWLSQMPTAAPSLLLGVASTWHQRPAVLVLQKALQCTWSVKLLSRLLPTPNTVINEI